MASMTLVISPLRSFRPLPTNREMNRINLETNSKLLGLFYYIALLALFIAVDIPTVLLIPLATLPSLSMYAFSGMETTSFCFWLFAGTMLIDREVQQLKKRGAPRELWKPLKTRLIFFGSGLLFGAAGLTRPEGILSGFLALAYLFFKKKRKGASYFSCGFFPPLISYLVFRIIYFKDILPNTFYAKSAFISKSILLKSAIFYLGKWCIEWIPIAFLIVLILAKTDKTKSVFPLIISIPVIMAVFSVGGYHMKGIRLILPVLVLAGYGAARSMKATSYVRGAGVTALAILVLSLQMFSATVLWEKPIFPMKFALKPRSHAAANGEIIGKFLEQSLQVGTLVAVNAAGAPPFFAPSLKFIDMLGLNDRVIARRRIKKITTWYQRKLGHFKGNGPYVLSENLDVIMVGLIWCIFKGDKSNLFFSDYEILKDSSFQEKYSAYKIEVPITPRQREWPEVKVHLENRKYFIIVWLRKDSEKVNKLRSLGIELKNETTMDSSM